MGTSDVPPPPDARIMPGPAGALPTAEILVGLAVFLAACVSILVTRVPGAVTLFWPVNGIAASLLIRLPKVRWASASVGILLAVFLASVLAAHRPWHVALLFD